MQPALFIAHGSPMLAVEQDAYTECLEELGRSLGRPRGVLVFSAHWESPLQAVNHASRYSTIHDFGGFPAELYQISYPAPGDPAGAKAIQERLAAAGVASRAEADRGLDHGAWVVLRLLFPAADVPVVALSVDARLTPKEQYAVGRVLGEFRDDYLVVGSGGTVHNFSGMGPDDGQVAPWAQAFDQWLADRLQDWDLEALNRYRELAPGNLEAVPRGGTEHLAPLFYAMGTADTTPRARSLFQGYRYRSLSHVVWQFGDAP